MAMVNTMLNPLQVKDSRWLTLEVCREFQRNRCTRPETECKFAHPPAHVEVQNGRVTCCFDSIKGKCQRKDPPCKYLHPPQHLKEQLLQNGRNNLIIKQMQMQAIAASQLQPMGMAGVMPAAALHENQIPRSTFPTWSTAGNYTRYQAHPYLVPQNPSTAFNPYISPSMTGMVPTMDASATATAVSGATPTVPGVISGTGVPAQQKVPRPDRLEVCREFQRGTCTRQPSECRFAHPAENVTVDSTDNHVTVCMDYVKGKCSRESCRYFHPPPHLQAQIKAVQQRANAAAASALGVSAVPGMMPVAKRPAVADNKGGMIPVYQHAGSAGTTAAYQQAALAMQLQQAPFVPVTIAGHPPSVPRF